MIKLGVACPQQPLGKDHDALQHFFRGVEGMGYAYLRLSDHVLGADRASRPDWRPYFGQTPLYDHTNPFHEPFVVFGLLIGLTKTIELSTGVLASTQRQTALLAKQAAEVDFLSGGRLRLINGTGWNDVEYEALGMDFHARGQIMDEQTELLRLLWTQELVTFHGKFHTITAAGINPMPVQRPIPIWFGGVSEPVLRRTGRMGDGWFPSYPYFNQSVIKDHIERIRRYASEAGRDGAAIGIQGMVYFHDTRFEMPPGAELPPKTLDEFVAYAHKWKELGATHLLVATPWAEQDVDSQLKALRGVKEALGPLF
jgi:probable F420-dependent oxidoreductase